MLAANEPRRLADLRLRPHLIWGPRDRHLVPRLLARGRAAGCAGIGDGTNLIDTVYVENAAERPPPGGRRPHARLPRRRPRLLHQPGRAGQLLAMGRLPAGLGRPAADPQVDLACGRRWRWDACWNWLTGLLRSRAEPPMTRFLAAQLARATTSTSAVPARTSATIRAFPWPRGCDGWPPVGGRKGWKGHWPPRASRRRGGQRGLPRAGHFTNRPRPIKVVLPAHAIPLPKRLPGIARLYAAGGGRHVGPDRGPAGAALPPAAAAGRAAGVDDRHRPAAVLAARHAAQPAKASQTAEKAIRRPGIDSATSAPWSTAPSAATSSSRPPPAASITASACRRSVPSTTSPTPAWACSTACVQVANMIELGQIRAGVVVGTESSRGLVENHHRRAQRRHVARRAATSSPPWPR